MIEVTPALSVVRLYANAMGGGLAAPTSITADAAVAGSVTGGDNLSTLGLRRFGPVSGYVDMVVDISVAEFSAAPS